MDLLVLGGGGFLGFHVVSEALAAGHGVTVLSRSGRPPTDGVRVLTGDREGALDALRTGSYDAVVDTFTDERPGAPAVRRTAQLLSGRVGHYCYVSGMSVYAPGGPAVPDEHAPVRTAGTEPDDDPLQARSLAKLAGESAVRDVFDGPSLFPRVGIMVGPRDPSGRFTWWPERVRRALLDGTRARVLAPGRADRPVQFSDARDIARWLVAMGAQRRGGVFNTVGPLRTEPISTVLDACVAAARASVAAHGTDSASDVEWVWQADEDALREAVRDVPEEGRPLWYPEDQIPQRAVDSGAAARAGLVFRDTSETAVDTLRWSLGRPDRALPEFDEPPVPRPR